MDTRRRGNGWQTFLEHWGILVMIAVVFLVSQAGWFLLGLGVASKGGLLVVYSSTVEWLLVGVWGMGSLLLAWFVPRRLYVYLGSVAISAPAIGYSMVGHGYLEMGGILHALSAGVYALPFHYLFQRFKRRKRKAR